jgi:hypothetical protein
MVPEWGTANSPEHTTPSEGQAVRVVPCVILLIAICLAPGCQNTNKRPGGGGGGSTPFMGSGADDTRRPEPTDPLLRSAAPGNGDTGLLAGRVIDTLTASGVQAHIQFICLEEAKEGETPVEMKTTANGTFTIQGLKVGKHYKLIARTTQGERKMAGIVIAEATNPNVFIKLKDELHSSTTPPVPPPIPPRSKAEDKGAEAPQKKTSQSGQERPASAAVPVWEPGSVTVPRPDAGKSPLRIQEPPPVPPPATQAAPLDRTRIAEGPEKGRKPRPVVVPGAVPVPSCVLTGKQLINFALSDLKGQPWVYQAQRSGRLMLIDFWGTACIPCLNVLPHLSIFQQQYGPAGLQVVGIACEG